MRRSGFRQKLKWRVIVHTTSDDSIRGVLVASHRDSLELGAAELLHAEGATTPLGTVLIPVAQVRFLQAIGE